MADRTTKVTLIAAVSQYVAGMDQARTATKKTADDGKVSLGEQREAMDKLGQASLVAGGLIAAGIGLAVKKYAEFDQAMSEVQASTHESVANLGLLRDAALEAGASTVFSATEAANAIDELAKAGISTADIMSGGLSGALDLASAGGLGVADAAAIAATALTQFKLRGEDVPHVADLLAAGAGKAQGSVEDLSQALNQGGLVASQAGFSIEETTGTLAAFASAGLLGSDAGTSLKTAILALQNPSEKSAGIMKQYGIEVYNTADGSMKTFSQIAGILKGQLGGLTDETRNAALAQIFGNDAVRAANVLYAQGSAGIEDWTNKVDDTGYAAETARLKLDNLNGDLEALGGAFDTALIKTGSAANDALRGIVQSITFVVEGFADLPEPLQGGALALAAVAAAVLLVSGASLTLIPKIAEMRAAFTTMGVSAKGAGLAIAGISVAIAAVTVGIGMFIQRQAEIASGADALADTLDRQTGAYTDNTRAMVVNMLQTKGAYGNALKAAGISQSELTDAVIAGGSALDKIKSKLTGANTIGGFFDGSGIAAGNAADAIGDVELALEGAKDAQKNTKAATDEGAQASEESVPAWEAQEDAVDGVVTSLSDLIAELAKYNEANRSAGEAQIAYQQTLSDAQDRIAKIREGVEGYAATLDITTQAGRDNTGALYDQAAAAEEAATKQLGLDSNYQNYRSTLEGARDALIQNAIDMGASAEEAQALADNVLKIPSEAQINIQSNVDAVNAQIQAFKEKWDGVKITTQHFIEEGLSRSDAASAARYTGQAQAFYGGGTSSTEDDGKAKGGYITGPGSGVSDEAGRFRLSNGEFVATAAATTRNRAALEFANAGGTIPGFGAMAVAQPAYTPSSTIVVQQPAARAVEATSRREATVVINPSVGMSETTIGRVAADSLNHELRRG